MKNIRPKIAKWYSGWIEIRHGGRRMILHSPSRLKTTLAIIKELLRIHWKWIIEKIIPIVLTMIGLYIAYLVLIAPRP